MNLHQFAHWLHGQSGEVHAGIVLAALAVLCILCDRIPWLRG